jgi:Mg2+ and Co2+ transporter CorA
MIDKTFREIEAKLSGTDALKPQQREELLQLVIALRQEVAELHQSHPDQARSIAGFAAVSAHEITRVDPKARSVQLAVEGLNSTVDGIEKAYPRLTEVVNRISTALSNLGI